MNKRNFIFILGLAGFIVMADNWVVSPILPAIAGDLNVPVTRAGLLISAYMIPFGLFQLIFGPLADRYGKRQVITVSMVIFTIATGLCAIGSSLTDLAIYRALTGIFAASVMPVSLALIGDLVPLEQRQAAIGMFMGISFLGQGLSMAIGGSIAYFLNWRGVFALYAALSVLSTLLLFTLGRHIPSKTNPDSRFIRPYFTLLSHRQSAFTYLVVLLEGILIIGSFSYLGGFLEHQFHFNYLTIGLIMTAFGAMAVIGGRLSGKMAPRLGRRKVLLIGLALATAANGLLGALGTNLAVVVTAVGLLGLGFMLAHSSLLTRATMFAMKARGTAMSLVAFCFMGGGGIGTALGGKFIASASYPSFFALYGALLAGLLVLAALVIRHEPHLETA
ncbi:MAG: MFS transporter [Desulfobulbaceae bacterium]